MDKTTIQINFDTLRRLKALKNFERQSYDEVLNLLIDNRDDDTLSEKEIEEIQLALENVKRGNVKPIEKVAAELEIILE